MKYINLKLAYPLYALLLLLVSASPYASEPEFTFAGEIDSISGNSMIVSDTKFQVSETVTVKNSAGFTVIVSDLEVGDKVGCNFTRTGRNTWVLTEIWELNESFDLDDFGVRLYTLLEQPYPE